MSPPLSQLRHLAMMRRSLYQVPLMQSLSQSSSHTVREERRLDTLNGTEGGPFDTNPHNPKNHRISNLAT